MIDDTTARIAELERRIIAAAWARCLATNLRRVAAHIAGVRS